MRIIVEEHADTVEALRAEVEQVSTLAAQAPGADLDLLEDVQRELAALAEGVGNLDAIIEGAAEPVHAVIP